MRFTVLGDMKYLWKSMVALCLFCSCALVSAQPRFPDRDSILTQDKEDVIGQVIEDSDNPFRDGASGIGGDEFGEGLNGIIYEEDIEDTGTAWEQTANYIKGLVNYALGLIGLVALIYLLYHGFIVLTAGSDEEKMNKGMKGVKYAAIALIGLGVSWFILSIVFWLLQFITNN